MPNDPNISQIRDGIQSVCNKLSLEVFPPNPQDWQVCIANSAIIIVDITPVPDSMFLIFQMGYASRSEKPILLIANQTSTPPNLGQQNVLKYNLENVSDFIAQFAANIVAVCQTQRIRYQKYPNMPDATAMQPLPILLPGNMRVENYVALADNFVDAHQYEEAYQEYTRAILYLGQQSNLAASHAYILFKRGFVAKRIGHLENALDDYNAAIQLKADYLDAYIARGLALSEIRRYDDAIQDFKKAAELKPDFTRVYVLAGMMQRLNHNYDEAMAQLNKAIELNPEFHEAFYQRGILHSDLQDLDKALADFSQAITLNVKYTDAYIKRGLLYLQSQKYDLALVDFNKAIELSADNVEAYQYRGQTLFEKGYKEFHEQAIRDWQKAIELGHPDARALEEKNTHH